MAGVLFFDLSPSWCGYCGGDGKGAPAASAWMNPDFGTDYGALACYVEDAYRSLMGRIDPDVVGFEAPILRSHDSLDDLRRIYGVEWELERVCIRVGQERGRPIICGELNLQRIKFEMTGNQWGTKSQVAKAVEALGIVLPPKDEGRLDAGDAAGGWFVTMAEHFPEIAAPWIAKHRGSLL